MRHLRRGVLVRLRGVARLRARVPRTQAVPFYDHATVPIDVKVEAERVPEREAMPFGRRRALLATFIMIRILQVHLHLCANQNFPARFASLGTQWLNSTQDATAAPNKNARISKPQTQARAVSPSVGRCARATAFATKPSASSESKNKYSMVGSHSSA